MTTPWIAAFAALCLCVAVLAAFVVGLLHRIAPVLDRAEEALNRPDPLSPDQGLPVGEQVAPFVVTDANGQRVTSAELWQRGPAVVLLVSAGCGPCEGVASELAAEGWRQRGLRLVAVVPDGKSADTLDFGPDVDVVYQHPELPVSAALRSSITPHAFVVNIDGTVLARGVGNSVESLTRLVAASRSVIDKTQIQR